MITDISKIHEQSIEYLRMQSEKNEEQIDENTTSITQLREKTDLIQADVANFHDQYNQETKDFHTRMSRITFANAATMQEHNDLLEAHDNAIGSLKMNAEKLTSEVALIKRSSTTAGANIPAIGNYKPKTARYDTEGFKAIGIVYQESERHHPHVFVEAFESETRGVAMEESYKCRLFVSLVQVKGAASWASYC
jgi:hypothetical protein